MGVWLPGAMKEMKRQEKPWGQSQGLEVRLGVDFT